MDITKIFNDSYSNLQPLDDQVLNGMQANFLAEGTAELPAGVGYYLRWNFMGITSTWGGPYIVFPSGHYDFNIPADATHTLQEPIQVEARFGPTGPIADTYTRNMRVFFSALDNGDEHNRPHGNSNANWFQHWGADRDGAVGMYSATGKVSYFDKNIEFRYAQSNGQMKGHAGGTVVNPIITLYDKARENFTANFISGALLPYLDSQGNTINAPAGAITIQYAKSGIDLVREVAAHELQHVNVHLLWEPGGLWHTTYGPYEAGAGGNDADGDTLPDLIEDAIPGLRWDTATTHEDFYLQGTDLELWIERAVHIISTGDAAKDWALPGKQSTPSQ